MASHGLLLEDLENIVSNPSQTEWRLNSTPSVQFYHDLHNFLRKRIPIEEMGMIYRSIDPTLCQETTSNKQAYSKIQNLICGHKNPSTSGSDDDSKEDSASKETPRDALCNVRTLVRRERRAKARIKTLQKSLRLSKRKNKIQEEKIEHLSTALKETRMLLCERNAHITHLQKTIQQLEQTIEVLNIELADVSQ